MPREFAAFIRNDIETWVYGSGIVGLSEVMAVQQFSITDGRPAGPLEGQDRHYSYPC
jgi:hypothetical protein